MGGESIRRCYVVIIVGNFCMCCFVRVVVEKLCVAVIFALYCLKICCVEVVPRST